ncbi:MAG: PLP-dependent transferase [Armatimonadetes bacterium]|nr:PLP-dependent transferase [Armatimonadota bacterium]
MSERRYDTSIIHAGESRDANQGLTTPIVRSSPFVYGTIEELDLHASGEIARFEYTRSGHPTGRVVEQKIAALEGAEDSLVLASGMAAITTTYLALLSQGDHVLVSDDGYKRTLTFARDVMPRFGVTGELFSATAPLEGIAAALRPNTRLVVLEMPSNPHLYVADLPAIAALCHDHGALLAVDSTIASPYNLRPIELGADLALQSATKFLAGHNDVLCGAVSGSAKLIEAIRQFHINLGAVLDPEGCYLLLRGIKTLAVRVERENATALRLARWLAARPEVRTVYYPGLAEHPSHELARRDMRGFGGMLSFELESDLAGVGRFIAALEVIVHGTSLGGVESLALHLYSMMRHSLSEEDRRRLGIAPELVRLSVGLEDPEDLIADLERGLAAMAR